MKVKCIDNYLMSYYLTENSPVSTIKKTVKVIKSKYNGKHVVLSRGSNYIVLNENTSSYLIINDCGYLTHYPKSYFIELNKGE